MKHEIKSARHAVELITRDIDEVFDDGRKHRAAINAATNPMEMLRLRAAPAEYYDIGLVTVVWENALAARAWAASEDDSDLIAQADEQIARIGKLLDVTLRYYDMPIPQPKPRNRKPKRTSI